MKRIHILGISGSLRADSTNSIILKSLGNLLPASVDFEVFKELDHLPHFNVGIADTEAVLRFKAAIARAQGVVICTPEYAFGVPGTLKNALDWTVGTGELSKMPVSIISASPLNSGGANALASLLLTLTALGAIKNEASSLCIANVKSKVADGRVVDDATLGLLRMQGQNLLKLIAGKLE